MLYENITGLNIQPTASGWYFIIFKDFTLSFGIMQLVEVPMIIKSHNINSYKCSYVYIKTNLLNAELNPTTPSAI